MDLKLEVLVVPVTDVDRAKRFYEKLGFRVDVDYAANQDYRIVQLTPPGSTASIIIGKGVTSAPRGPIDRLVLAVSDIETARAELLAHGIAVGEVFHDAGGGLGAGFVPTEKSHAQGADPARRSYASYATFSDPDGNVWMLQEIRERLPGRGVMTDVAGLAALLHETEQHHGAFEKAAPPHNWWDWYAAYADARERGSAPEEASATAARYMAEVKHVAPAA
jgi:catechol 2,3-dioxygenase-like lactoylglutathione lyase family enzyme